MTKFVANLTIKKFGGTSLADPHHINHVADIIYDSHCRKMPCVVVVSAMSDATDQIIKIADTHDAPATHKERDVMLCTGEQISAALLSMALEKRGVSARSWMGWQIPIQTTEHAGCAHITHIEGTALLDQVHRGIVPIVCGFQGIDQENRITTLGRGGSDTTAVALAHYLHAEKCEIFTDVHGVYTADPSSIYGAKCYESISYSDMLVLSRNGARVLHPRCVIQAQKSNIPIHVLSTWNYTEAGTKIHRDAPPRKGIAIKEAVQWLLPNLCEKKIQDIYQKCQFYEVPILHWAMSPSGLSFITWKEHMDILVPIVQTPSINLDIITVVGFNAQERSQCLLQHTHDIKQYFLHDKHFMIVSHRKNSLGLMKNIHTMIDMTSIER